MHGTKARGKCQKAMLASPPLSKITEISRNPYCVINITKFPIICKMTNEIIKNASKTFNIEMNAYLL